MSQSTINPAEEKAAGKQVYFFISPYEGAVRAFTKKMTYPFDGLKPGDKGYEPIRPRSPIGVFFHFGDASGRSMLDLAKWAAGQSVPDLSADGDGYHPFEEVNAFEEDDRKLAKYTYEPNSGRISVDMMPPVMAAIARFAPKNAGIVVEKAAENDEFVIYKVAHSDMVGIYKFQLDDGVDAGNYNSNGIWDFKRNSANLTNAKHQELFELLEKSKQ